MNDAVRIFRGLRVVGDHQDGLAEAAIQIAQKCQDRKRVRRIEVARGFIGEEDSRPCGERSGDGYPLLLAARHFAGFVVQAAGDAKQFEDVFQFRREGLNRQAGDVKRGSDVVPRAEVRKQIEFLEDEADVFPAQFGSAGIAHLGDIAASDDDLAVGRGRQSAHDVKQRRFAGAGRSDDREELALGDLEVHTAERFDGDFAGPIHLAEIADADDRFRRYSYAKASMGSCRTASIPG